MGKAEMPLLPRTLPDHPTRRDLLAAGALLAAADQIPALVDTLGFPTDSRVVFSREQQARLQGAKSLCLFFGGAAVEAPQKLGAAAIEPTLSRLGPVGYVTYGKDGVDPHEIAQSIKAIKEQYGISEVNAYLSSAGLQAAAETFDLLGDEIQLKHAFLSSTPVDISTTRAPFNEYVIGTLDAMGYRGGMFLTTAMNVAAYHSLYKEGSAPALLLWDEGVLLKDGAESVKKFVRRVEQDQTKLAYVTLSDRRNDKAVNPITSEQTLRSMGLDPYLPEAYRVGGNQQHENFAQNTPSYVLVLNNVIDQWDREESRRA